MRCHRIAAAALLLCVGATFAHAAEFIWIEGESAQRHSMRRHNWYDDVARESLSGGNWLSHYAAGESPQAEYRFSVPETGDYHFWIRCNTVAGPKLSYRLGSGVWTEVALASPVGVVNIAANGKPDMRFVGWVEVGTIPLKRGAQSVGFKFHSANNNHGAIDCFVLSPTPFRPRGALKPGERSGRANPGFFAWEPDVDTFSERALVDLSGLNESVAGQSGRIRAEGNDFVLGDGKKVKFWAANAGPAIWGLDHRSQIYLAKRLAKSGVNMVRLHGSIYASRDPKVDRTRLDNLQHMVHAFKQEGIYTELSFFFPLWFKMDGDRTPFMLLFFDEQLQRYHRDWASALLTTPNPYTKIPLGEDPAVAIVEIVNEDSHFFWTFGKKNMTPQRWRVFTKLYGDWLTKRYGSLAKAVAAWGDVREPGDDLSGGRVDLYGAWEMTAAGARGNAGKRKRISDQVRFLSENMRGYYKQTIGHFRSACGYSGLVSCGNWHVSDASTLDALERYCYTTGDVIDHHGYFDYGHKGEAANYSVRPGHQFTSQSALHLKQNSPLPYVETEGYPHIVSEIGWPTPNAYRAEFTFLTSTYGSLQGLDGVFNFAIGSAGWDQRISKFPMNTPVTLGCFPAAALIYRRGDVREAPAVVMDHVDVDELYKLKGSPVHVRGAFDQFRAADIPANGKKSGAIESIDPLSFYVGRVARSFQGSPQNSYQQSLSGFVDRGKKTVNSITGELSWNHGTGVATVNTSSAQGAAGFLGRAGRIDLADVSLDMQNDYGTLTVVALDDKPIAQSGKILIQTMTIEQLYGFKATGKDNLSGRIESVGSAPFGVEKFEASVTLTLTGGKPATVTACDEHGYPRDKRVKTTRRGAALTVTLDEASPYHVLTR